MAYFSNGTEGDMYEAEYCKRCWHFRDRADGRGEGCPVMDVHIANNYDQFGSKELEWILSTLIPKRSDGFGDTCSMFIERDKVSK